ncbi:PH domain-containing protein [Nesterenkonia lacusekhoensis]|uniref:Membrane protein YdbS with pleckstrin-like domain n=1 Tax=Nesterenkonia lacusekhoensis TaxID=150832 RepID=A0ABS4T435_9MICC|nr:PH domain-containing protein [Nesterenkonia lacusekhoensis]MBP2319210.1 membrane protein YdbS with pleckstrin-like domain [Nesterenkonia lacusekhoensis]
MPAARPEASNEPIDPAGVEWTRVDEKYIPVGFITAVLGWLVVFVAVGTPLVLDWMDIIGGIPLWLSIPVCAVVVVWAAVDLALIPRQARAIGYHEREDDLLVRRGILFQKLEAVPYGRLQYVDIQAGPLMRKFGLCTVQLKTAASATDASIPGVPRQEGARLREELSARGQARLAGL